jgi:outer membrane protein OmpA-like peptidoglycan-associated protein
LIEGHDVRIYSDLHFRSGSDQLFAYASAELDAIAVTLKANPGILWVEASGFAAESDDPVVLSLLRAQAVVDALVERGVPREKLGAVGYGPYCPRRGETERVEVRIVLTQDGPLGGERGCAEAAAEGLAPPPLDLPKAE